ncbi:MotE family protein [Zavarzinia sp. CC-PAN008]|uniref:MotE family protein n=1 Tax=Zavarzinia sp. CC-PAN008 TaxID=3243332 RepID=UPI003F7443C6
MAKLMLDQVRLLPAVLVGSVLLLGIKVGDLVQGAQGLYGSQPAYAAAASPPAAAPATPAPAEPNHDSPAAAPVEAAAPPPPAPLDPTQMSASEIQLLQDLGRRRAELDQRAADLDLREKMLEAAGHNIDERIAELKRVEESIKGLLGQSDEQEKARIASLVKTYETMKPADAARIFNTLDMPILLAVTQRMKEAKLAPVMAQMDPLVANRLTVELATHRALPDSADALPLPPAANPAPAAPATGTPASANPAPAAPSQG